MALQTAVAGARSEPRARPAASLVRTAARTADIEEQP